MGYETAPFRVDKPDFNTSMLLFNDSPNDAADSGWVNSATKQEVLILVITVVDLPNGSTAAITLSESPNADGSGSATVYSVELTASGLHVVKTTKTKQYIRVAIVPTGSWEDDQPAITVFALR